MGWDEGMIVCRAARKVVEGGVLTGESSFVPGLRTWTPGAADELFRRFVENFDGSPDEFLVKLNRQIAEGGNEAIVLAAELLYLNVMPLSLATIGVNRKLEILNRVLSWASFEVKVPDELAAAASPGYLKGGQAFLNYRWAQFAFLIRLTRLLVKLPYGERESALRDPWRFRDLAESVIPDYDGKSRARAQFHVLLFLLFPDVFLPVSVENAKRLIRDAFADLLAEPSEDLDRDLCTIRRRIEAEHGRFSFYDEPWRSRWEPRRPQKGWLVRGANVDGVNAITQWLAEGFCSVSFCEIDQLPAGASRQQIKEAVATGLPDANRNSKDVTAGQLWRFLSVFQPGDLIATVDGDAIYVGTITSDAYYDLSAGRGLARRRSVEWNPNAMSRRTLPEEVQAKLKTAMTIGELTSVMAALATSAGLEEKLTDEVLAQDETRSLIVPVLPQRFADDLLMPLPWLQETADLLTAKRQMILYGPPGTGKTYLATKLGEELAGPDRTSLVQFHPSYGYEDFVEGFRPRLGENGMVGFDLVPGPFKNAVEAAEKEPERPYVLLIDEINRANLAKVFGELYFLLEYRNREITLQYSPDDPFKLPKNVLVIGTMNTVDRSVALIDAAMRRRFVFRSLAPDRAPVDGLLRRWLEREKLPVLPALLLEEVNRRLNDPDRAVGPSYLMTPNVATRRGLELIWKGEILPLLEDQLYGKVDDIEADYGLPVLLAALGHTLP
ncbi:AAA family ATPase [Sphaerisporangium rufum]|uniref:AAA family ATPase n=1 Tax=Sphaerisporangium rufum TaxID=1381558 RepID=UPI001951BCC0|nr:AAA family ATPase [Sphaerisporangium rufum]